MKTRTALTGFAVCAGSALAGAAPGAGGSAATLSASDILTRVVGNTIVFQDDATDRVEEYLATDGTVHGHSRVHGDYRAEWQIRFGRYLCLVAQDPMQSGCVQVVVRPDRKVELHLNSGETEGPFELVPGNPLKL